ncbi:MAG: twin-arginine translocation signal domain-containing protein [Bacillota bacterium]
MHQGKQSLLKDLVQHPFSRRSFFKLGAALGGTAALGRMRLRRG